MMRELNRLLVGRELEEAKNTYKKSVIFRVIEKIDESNSSTNSIKNRVNVMINNGVITEVLGMY